MAISKIISPEVQAYIEKNINTDISKFLLTKSPFSEINQQIIAQQIKGKKVAQKKFPFLNQENIVFPPNLNLEQASSEETASYKASLVEGKSYLDLTTGFGIDSFFISQSFEEITLVEQNSELLEIVKHNWSILNRKAEFINQNSVSFIETIQQPKDWVFIDPARRDIQNKKKFLLEDLSPNILEIQGYFPKIGKKIMIKLSPLIDLKYLISNIQNLTEIHIIGVKNEVKEVLLIIDTTNIISSDIKCICVNLKTEENNFSFNFNELNESESSYLNPLEFIYIPNNSILKSGAFNLISTKFNLKKLDKNTHIYTSKDLVDDFPGRVFEAKTIDPKSIKKGESYNIISKNHPLSPEEIKKKYKLKDGGNRYLIFTQALSKKIIIETL